MITKEYLVQHYVYGGRSVSEVARELGCSQNRVTYWLQKHNISKRTISEAIYLKSNPDGDPFKKMRLSTGKEWFLYGLGLGLYWGEGTKANKNSVRLGNTDPDLVKVFIKFLKEIYQVDIRRLRFGLQVFSDTPKDEALRFWMESLDAPRDMFQKVVVTESGKVGTYGNKSRFGVITIYFHNTKLRDSICSAINELRTT